MKLPADTQYTAIQSVTGFCQESIPSKSKAEPGVDSSILTKTLYLLKLLSKC